MQPDEADRCAKIPGNRVTMKAVSIFMRRFGACLVLSLAVAVPLVSRPGPAGCGTTRETGREALFLHHQSSRTQPALRRLKALSSPSAGASEASRDIGHIAVLEDSDGAVARLNRFNLAGNQVRFTPTRPDAARYRYTVAPGGYDATAAAAGSAIDGIADDDTRRVALPFPFPFFGAAYREVFVNSDGNLTFNSGDVDIRDRSLGRMTAGQPRIAGLFDDLDPTAGAGRIRTLSEAGRFVVTWDAVREYSDGGNGAPQTFQVMLYPDGRIEFAHRTVSAASAVVGISPGGLAGETALVSFRNDPSGEYAGTVAERFTDQLELDIVSVAQKFYRTHEDSFDYLAIFNNMDISPGSSALALESTVRNSRTGYGDGPVDNGRDYGSASRLQAVLNLGPLSQYPKDPTALVPARRSAGDTPLTIIAHEAGHLFLAFASARNPNDPMARPMLGYQASHWSFLFNSEASLLEGERIVDRGPSATPRFVTTDTVQGYSPLDQYLMGFRPASDVPPTFYVTGPPAYLAQSHPLRNYSFDGQRVDVTVDDVIRGEGRRTPDHTVAQRTFRFAFILVVPQGTTPSDAELAQLENYRARFEPFFAQASDNRAAADATLSRSLRLSMFPAAGIVQGGSANATLTLATPPVEPLTIDLQAPDRNAGVPAAVTFPAGARSVTFPVSGLRAGVEALAAVPRDVRYETARARVQVSPAPALRVEAVSGDRQLGVSGSALPEPVVVRVTDVNRLPYPGVRLQASASGGSLSAPSAITDDAGQASFGWTLGSAPSNQLRVGLENNGASLTLSAGTAVAVVTSAVNAASGTAGLAPGTFGTVTGVNLTGGASTVAGAKWADAMDGVQVLLDGRAMPLLYTSDRQINFYVPSDVPGGTALLTVKTAAGVTAGLSVAVNDVMPGVFVDGATGTGAVLKAGTGQTTAASPVKVGDYVEIYCTGLGPVRTVGGLQQTVYQPVVYMGGIPSVVAYSGQTAVPGLYQVNAQVPFGIAAGTQALSVRVGGVGSNEVKINVTP
jgi:uncharacterized protein (TIGR03437 family)